MADQKTDSGDNESKPEIASRRGVFRGGFLLTPKEREDPNLRDWSAIK